MSLKGRGQASLPYSSSYLRYQKHDFFFSILPPSGGERGHTEPIPSAWTHQTLLTWKEHILLLSLRWLLAPTIQTQKNWQPLKVYNPNTKLPPHDLSSDVLFPEQPALSLWMSASNSNPHPSPEHKLVNLSLSLCLYLNSYYNCSQNPLLTQRDVKSLPRSTSME